MVIYRSSSLTMRHIKIFQTQLIIENVQGNIKGNTVLLNVLPVLILVPDKGKLISGKDSVSHVNTSKAHFAPQHFLYFFPLPQGQGSLGPTLMSLFLRTGLTSSSPWLAAVGWATCWRSWGRASTVK